MLPHDDAIITIFMQKWLPNFLVDNLGLREGICNLDIYTMLDNIEANQEIMSYLKETEQRMQCIEKYRSIRLFLSVLFNSSNPYSNMAIRKVRKIWDPLYLPGELEQDYQAPCLLGKERAKKDEAKYKEDMRKYKEDMRKFKDFLKKNEGYDPLSFDDQYSKIKAQVIKKDKTTINKYTETANTYKIHNKLAITNERACRIIREIHRNPPLFFNFRSNSSYKDEFLANIGTLSKETLLEKEPIQIPLDAEEANITEVSYKEVININKTLSERSGDKKDYTNTRYLIDARQYRVWPMLSYLAIETQRMDQEGNGLVWQYVKADTEQDPLTFIGQGDMVIMNLRGQIYSTPKLRYDLHHTSLSQGLPLIFAGFWEVKDGVITKLIAYSGHYRTNILSMAIFMSILSTIYLISTSEALLFKYDESNRVYIEITRQQIEDELKRKVPIDTLYRRNCDMWIEQE